MLLCAFSLAWREVLHFVRQRNRLVGALLQPVLMWFLIGSGLDASFRPAEQAGMSYIDFFFTGVVLMILLFTAIFSTFSIIEDRQAGFLQGVVVAPVPRAGIALGKVLGGTCLGFFQAALFLLLMLTPMVTLELALPGLCRLLLWMLVLGVMLTSLGTAIAWSMESVQGYHAIMSVVLLPLWVFSGAPFPTAGAPTWLSWAMTANPLSHGLSLMRQCFENAPAPDVGSPTVSAVYVLLATVLCFAAATRAVARN
jgi:ABC-2 type transport system permease protein